MRGHVEGRRFFTLLCGVLSFAVIGSLLPAGKDPARLAAAQKRDGAAAEARSAVNPAPADGAQRVDPAHVVLRWKPPADAVSHRLFFGPSNPPPFREEMKRVQYQPGLLAPGASYWWRVDELTPSGMMVGKVWHFTTAGAPDAASVPAVMWSQCLAQPAAWYAGPEAGRIADSVLLYQRKTGGWPKNIDMAVPLSPEESARIASEKSLTDSTIDNNSTTTQILFLARVFEGAQRNSLREGILKGVGFLLDAQYPNGGWPQYYPLRSDYSRQITFNDDAVVHVMNLLGDVAAGRYPFAWADSSLRARSARAVEQGIQVILAAQIRVNGALTAWCAQHDAKTLLPCKARSYELPSISGSESIGVVRLLMAIERPSPEVVAAIEAAVKWFRASAITGWRLDRISDPSKPRGFDYVLLPAPAAPPLWARFYDVRTNAPMFVGRDGVVKARLSDIEYERRTGYSYLGPYAVGLLEAEYPAWKKRAGREP